MNTNCTCRRGGLVCAAILIAICSTAIGATASAVDLRVAEIVAVAMKPIA